MRTITVKTTMKDYANHGWLVSIMDKIAGTKRGDGRRHDIIVAAIANAPAWVRTEAKERLKVLL